MIKCELLTIDKRPIGFYISGHAGYSEYGSDIVCSGVSALAQTAFLGLRDIVKIPIDAEINDDGLMKCVIKEEASDEQREKAQLILEVMQYGLRNIEYNYGKYLRVAEREVTRQCLE